MKSRAKNGILARREREGALAADERLLDGPPCEEGARDADHGEDDLLLRGCVRGREAERGTATDVAVGDVVRAVSELCATAS